MWELWFYPSGRILPHSKSPLSFHLHHFLCWPNTINLKGVESPLIYTGVRRGELGLTWLVGWLTQMWDYYTVPLQNSPLVHHYIFFSQKKHLSWKPSHNMRCVWWHSAMHIHYYKVMRWFIVMFSIAHTHLTSLALFFFPRQRYYPRN